MGNTDGKKVDAVNASSWTLDTANKKNSDYRESRKLVLQALGGQCKCCGFADFRALQIDHVNGGGVREIRAAASWKPYHAKIMAAVQAKSSQYQLLCANCNWIKRAEQNENSKCGRGKGAGSTTRDQRRAIVRERRILLLSRELGRLQATQARHKND